MDGMRCQHAGCPKTSVVVVQVEATLAVRSTLPVSLTASAYACEPHAAAVAKDLARRVTEGAAA